MLYIRRFDNICGIPTARREITLQREKIWSVVTLLEFSTLTINDWLVINQSSIVTVLNSRNLLYVTSISFSLYNKNERQITQRSLREFSNVMFISYSTSRFCAIRQIVTRCPVLYDGLCGQGMFTPKHKQWQPDCFVCWQLFSAVFGHSKVTKVMVNQTSKGAFVIVSWGKIRM